MTLVRGAPYDPLCQGKDEGMLPSDLPPRLAAKIQVNPSTGCWEWTAYIDPLGYSRAQWEGKTGRAHRAVYRILVGEIPAGLVIDHLCRVRHCVNPAHLEVVTHRDNLLRGNTLAAANAAKPRCPRGHEYIANPYVPNARWCRQCNNMNRQANRG